MEYCGKASKAKEESLIKQYEEEINLILIDEIAERKIQAKEEVFIVSLQNKIQEKEWITDTKKCNEVGEEQTPVENNNRLLVTTKEGYEIIIKVDNEKIEASIIDITKIGEIKEEKIELNFSITNSKLTEETNISIGATSTRRLQKLELKAQDVVIYTEENIDTTTYNKTNIGIEQLKNLDQLPFFENITVTLEATTTSSKETKNIENVKNYTISTITQLNQLADVVNSGNNLQNETIVQLADIDANLGKWTENEDGTTAFQSGASQWQGIGSATYDYDTHTLSNIKSFSGIFNGKNHKIEGIYINHIEKDEVGLFSVNEGTIKNVVLKNSSIKGRYLVGGIVSFNEGIIQNCTNYAVVSGTRTIGGICSASSGILNRNINYGQIIGGAEAGWKLNEEDIGGIAGWGSNTITECKNYGKIISTVSKQNIDNKGAGGIIGKGDFDGEISNCCNFGDIIDSGSSTGGIIGFVSNNAGQNFTISKCYNVASINGEISGGIMGWGDYIQIQDCYNTGNVKGNYNIGGIIGWTRVNGLISNCYNVGQVTGTPTNLVGGILGRYNDTPTLINCYHLNTSSNYGIGDDNGGWATLGNDWGGHIEVKNEAEMKSLANILGNNWTEDINNRNNGYPILKWQT